MASPSAAITAGRPDIAESFQAINLEASRRRFIAQRVFPVIETNQQAGAIGNVPIGSLLQPRETLRAPGANYNRGNFTFSTTSYVCEEHGAEEPIDDRERNMYPWLNLDLLAGQRALDVVLRNAEKRVADAVFNATTWTGSTLTTAVTYEWSEWSTATPITDVEAAKRRVWNLTGLDANALIINKRVFDNLKQCAQIVDRIKYSGFTDPRPGAISEQALAVALGLDMILVGGGGYNDAKEGQTVSVKPIWSDEYAMICCVATSGDPKEACIGRTFHWSQDGSQVLGTVEQYREERTRGDIIRVRHDIDEVVILSSAGHMLSNITK